MSDSFPMHWWFQRLENDVWLFVITDQLRLLERHEMELLHRQIQILSNAIKIFKYKDFLCIYGSLEEMGDFPVLHILKIPKKVFEVKHGVSRAQFICNAKIGKC